ncbi:MAG: hypothetical protein OSA97_08225 [Nevskia sp.]|nr:hypothetical protein [Nevskia sp.]
MNRLHLRCGARIAAEVAADAGVICSRASSCAPLAQVETPIPLEVADEEVALSGL